MFGKGVYQIGAAVNRMNKRKRTPVKFVERQLQSGETGVCHVIASSRTSAATAARLASKKVKPGTVIAVHYDPANYAFDAVWHAYAMPSNKDQKE